MLMFASLWCFFAAICSGILSLAFHNAAKAGRSKLDMKANFILKGGLYIGLVLSVIFLIASVINE